MSLLRPKDGDYINRGLTLYLVWLGVGFPGMSLLGLLVSHSLGGAFIGLLSTVVVAIAGYWQYLKFGERELHRRDVEKLRLMIEMRRGVLEMQMKGYER